MMMHPHTGSQVLTPDHSLVARMARGEAFAFHELLRRHGDSEYALAFSILFDSDVAERVVDEAFNEAWVRARWYTGRQGSVHVWLGKLTRRRALVELARMTESDRPAA